VQKVLKLKNLSKSFGDKVVLSGFSYDFPKSGVVCIKGASGCGKTTLLRIISGLETADSGEVKCGGVLSYLFQEDRLLNWLTAIENVSCVMSGKSSERREKAAQLLSLVGLAGNENEQIGHLSGGMKRRVAFARALATNPDILLLDEPFNGLDDLTRSVLSKLVLQFSENHLVLLVTHDSEDIETLANSVIAL